jgi:hypothetical protein
MAIHFHRRETRRSNTIFLGPTIVKTAVAVLCGQGKSDLITGEYSEQFELELSSLDGFKMNQNPVSTKYRYSGRHNGWTP